MTAVRTPALDAREQRVLDRFLSLVRERFGDDLVAVWLFGSRARGERRSPDSDVDLLVITRGGRVRDLPTVTELVFEAAEAEGADPIGFAAHVADPAWVEDRRRIRSFFIQEVDRDKTVLLGEP